MNILLWVLQVALAVLCIAGGAYKIANFADLAKGLASMRALPQWLWIFLGAYEILGGAGLFWPAVAAYAAIAMAIESSVISGLYLYYGDKAPVPYTLVMAVLAALIAYGRIAP